jgi:hypothetical protein
MEPTGSAKTTCPGNTTIDRQLHLENDKQAYREDIGSI